MLLIKGDIIKYQLLMEFSVVKNSGISETGIAEIKCDELYLIVHGSKKY
jgi:hypothetical protein